MPKCSKKIENKNRIYLRQANDERNIGDARIRPCYATRKQIRFFSAKANPNPLGNEERTEKQKEKRNPGPYRAVMEPNRAFEPKVSSI